MVLPLRVVPRGPVAVPDTVLVPLALLVVVPEAVLVLPLGPVTVAESPVPLRVLVAEAVPVAVAPFAVVAVPLAVAVLPVRVTELEAVAPRRVVTDFWAEAAEAASERVRRMLTASFMVGLLGCSGFSFNGSDTLGSGLVAGAYTS